MNMLTNAERQANRDLYDFVWKRLCEKCRNVLGDRCSPNEWHNARGTGLCTSCRNPSYSSGLNEKDWPSQSVVAYVERDFVHPSHYE